MLGQNELHRRLGNLRRKIETLVPYFDGRKKREHDLDGKKDFIRESRLKSYVSPMVFILYGKSFIKERERALMVGMLPCSWLYPGGAYHGCQRMCIEECLSSTCELTGHVKKSGNGTIGCIVEKMWKDGA